MTIDGDKVYLSVGEFMRLARRKNRLTVKQASKKSGVNYGTIYKIEADESVSRLDSFYKLCKAYSVKLDNVCKIGFDKIPVDINGCEELKKKRG